MAELEGAEPRGPLTEGVSIDTHESFEFSALALDAFELDVKDVTEQEGFQYPALLLRDVLFMDCLRVLKSQKRKSFREVDAWVCTGEEGDEEFRKIGTLQLDSNTLLILRHLRITATLYPNEGEVMALNLEDPAVLEKFI